MRTASSYQLRTYLRKSLPLPIVIGCLSLMSCGTGTGPESGSVYEVTNGACGNVAFVEKIGSDSASAFAEVRDRKIRNLQRTDLAFELYELSVVDRNGSVPMERFYAVRVLHNDTRLLVHAVGEVITSNGNLYRLNWCPD